MELELLLLKFSYKVFNAYISLIYLSYFILNKSSALFKSFVNRLKMNCAPWVYNFLKVSALQTLKPSNFYPSLLILSAILLTYA